MAKEIMPLSEVLAPEEAESAKFWYNMWKVTAEVLEQSMAEGFFKNRIDDSFMTLQFISGAGFGYGLTMVLKFNVVLQSYVGWLMFVALCYQVYRCYRTTRRESERRQRKYASGSLIVGTVKATATETPRSFGEVREM